MSTLEEQIRTALPAYGVDPDVTLEAFRVSENATYLVGGAELATPLVIRVQQWGVHSKEEIQAEISWIRALRQSGVVRTAGVVPTGDGEDVIEIGGQSGPPVLATMFEFVSGREPRDDELLQWFDCLGELSALLHRHSRSWLFPASFTRPRWDEVGLIGESPVLGDWRIGISVGAQERTILGRAADVVMARLRCFGHGADRFGLIHADLRLANLLVNDEGVKVIDFDDCGFSWHLYDLASALTFIEDRADVEILIDLWVSGYRKVMPLSSEDMAEIPTFLMARRLWMVGWCGLRRESQVVQAEGGQYTEAACEAAERYLSLEV